MDEERWATLLEFPNYDISESGAILNTLTGRYLSPSFTNHGHLKVALAYRGTRYTRSVALLVAQNFVEPPDPLCDSIIMLNGKLEDVRASNLMWRPTWFAWKYTRQLRVDQPPQYTRLSVANMNTGMEYNSIVELCMAEGLLVDDVWRSTYKGISIYPTNNSYEITERV